MDLTNCNGPKPDILNGLMPGIVYEPRTRENPLMLILYDNDMVIISFSTA